MKYFIPIILISASLGLFFLFTNPTYLEVQDLRTRSASYNEALNNAKKLQEVRDVLVSKYNAFSADDLSKLNILLPDNVDNIKLVLEVVRVATQYGMLVENIKYDTLKAATPAAGAVAQAAATGPKKDYGEFDLEFSVTGSYRNFSDFLGSLEKNLRIVDIGSVSFTAGDTGAIGDKTSNEYKYDLKIKTYYLKG